MRRERWGEEGWREKGGGGAGQGLANILPGPKPQTDREMERERGIWEDEGKSEKEPFLISADCHFC